MQFHLNTSSRWISLQAHRWISVFWHIDSPFLGSWYWFLRQQTWTCLASTRFSEDVLNLRWQNVCQPKAFSHNTAHLKMSAILTQNNQNPNLQTKIYSNKSGKKEIRKPTISQHFAGDRVELAEDFGIYWRCLGSKNGQSLEWFGGSQY